MTGRGTSKAAVMLGLAALAGIADAAPQRRGQGARRARPPAARPAPEPAAVVLDADGLPSFAGTAAPLAPAEQRLPIRALEGRVQAMLTAHCPAQPIDGADRARLVGFDTGFAGDLAAADATTRQVALEAYRRCIDRAIAAIQASPNYVIRNPREAACVECPVLLSDLAVQAPRLRVLKGLTYLAPAHMADQNPKAALETLRQGVADFGAVQASFQQQAQVAFDAKRRIVQQGRHEAEQQATTRGKGAALGALLGAVQGIVRGQGAGQALQGAGGTARQQFGQIGKELVDRERQVAQQQSAINANRRGMFVAPPLGNWSDDGIRVTLPRVVASVSQGGTAVNAPGFGALTATFHAYRVVRLMLRLDAKTSEVCTGSIVGPRLILTNRHCATTQNGEGAVLAPNAFTVEWRYAVAGDTDMRTGVTTSRVAKVVTTSLAERLSPRSINDWAFLVTREKVGADGWLRLADPVRVARAGEFRIALAGYSADLNQGSEITMDWGCRARWLDNSIFHRCHMWSGASGSPIVAVDGAFARDEIVGVNAADYGDLQSGSQEGLRVGPASAEMYATWLRLRAEQRGDE
ncbi:trypsin-like peptidase domain-containing protein [Sphingomonas sp.]|uniref:trypsin-like peptidase domain-containing protein n=1 Tax=Sphingomonas sp. TaxID=28214 RepID=UPI003B001F76